MITDKQFAEGLALVEQANHILIGTHHKPDGDACGSLVVLRDALLALGKRVEALLLSPVPEWYDFIAKGPLIQLHRDLSVDDLQAGLLEQVDLVILVDVNSRAQLPHFADKLDPVDVPVLVIDHHVSSDGLGTLELVDHTAAATGLLIYEFIKFAQWPLSAGMAEALFVAAATDTGWFQFGNADSRVYRDCAALIDAGAHPKRIHDNLYNNFSRPRFKLMMAMLNSLQLHFESQFALLVIRQSDFEASGATSEDTENLINECHRMRSVRASTLLVELPDGRVRCSLRSRDVLDVSVVANQFGGGGHKMAAGTFLPGPLKHAQSLILAAMKDVVCGK